MTLTSRVSGSETRVAPEGSVMSAAVNWVPASTPESESSNSSGMSVASTSISM